MRAGQKKLPTMFEVSAGTPAGRRHPGRCTQPTLPA